MLTWRWGCSTAAVEADRATEETARPGGEREKNRAEENSWARLRV